MIGYFKHKEDNEWQELGTVTGSSLSIEEPTDSFKAETPHKVSISFSLPANAMSKELRAALNVKYPKMPRKLKKKIKGFRKIIGLPYKKCSRLELIRTYIVVWDWGPDYRVNPGWLNRAGWKIKKGGQ